MYFPGLDIEHLTDEHKDALLADIRSDLDAAALAIERLPAHSRAAVAAAHGLFAELATRIAATPASELRRTRVRVPGPAKARVLAGALARTATRTGDDGAHPVRRTAALVQRRVRARSQARSGAGGRS